MGKTWKEIKKPGSDDKHSKARKKLPTVTAGSSSSKKKDIGGGGEWTPKYVNDYLKSTVVAPSSKPSSKSQVSQESASGASSGSKTTGFNLSQRQRQSVGSRRHPTAFAPFAAESCSCLYCPVTVRSVFNIRYHMKAHHPSPVAIAFTCKDCDKGFDFKWQHPSSCILEPPGDCREAICAGCGNIMLAQEEFVVRRHLRDCSERLSASGSAGSAGSDGSVRSVTAATTAGVMLRCRVCQALMSTFAEQSAHCWGSEGKKPFCLEKEATKVGVETSMDMETRENRVSMLPPPPPAAKEVKPYSEEEIRELLTVADC